MWMLLKDGRGRRCLICGEWMTHTPEKKEVQSVGTTLGEVVLPARHECPLGHEVVGYGVKRG